MPNPSVHGRILAQAILSTSGLTLTACLENSDCRSACNVKIKWDSYRSGLTLEFDDPGHIILIYKTFAIKFKDRKMFQKPE